MEKPTDISGRAMLVSLRISSWGNTRKDTRVTEATIKQHSAKADAGRFSKHLLPPVELEAIAKHCSSWRTWHRQQTLPWMDEGARILTTKNFFDYGSATKDHRYEFERLVDEFCKRYPQLVQEAPVRLNGMFDAAQYPEVEQIKTKFSASTNYAPLPLSEDFRLSMGQEQLAELKAEYEASLATAVKEAKKDVVERLLEPLSHMTELLRKKDLKGGSIRNELIGNLREAIVLIPQLQLDDDPRFSELLKAADKLADVDVQTLRMSQIARRDTADEAQKIAEQLKGYFA